MFPEKTLLRPREVAQKLKVSTSTVYRWFWEDKIQGIKLKAGTIRIFSDSIPALEEDSKVDVKPTLDLPKRSFRPDEVATILQTTKRTVYRLIKDQTIKMQPGVKPLRIPHSEVAKLIGMVRV